MPEELLVREVLDLPDEVPECVVNIRQFDDPDVLAENVQDYVITPRVAQELEDFVRRLHRSVEWHEGGRGHFVHGSFGSGKSHFMATLGLILENHPAIWGKDHPAIQKIHAKFGDWLAGHPVLVIPVYMLPYHSFREAMYKAANKRLRRLGKPACEFSDARKVIQRFQAEAEKFGDVVYQRFFEESRIRSQRVFERKLQGEQEQLDELAAEILTWRGELAEAEERFLYPDSFVDGMLKLTRHAQDLGYAAVIFFVDELILYLSSKSGREWIQDLNDLGSIIDPAHRADQAVPLWVVVAKQRNIQETVPEDNSQKHIFDHLNWQKDRFPRTTELADVELIPITQERELRVLAALEVYTGTPMFDLEDVLGKVVRAEAVPNRPDDCLKPSGLEKLRAGPSTGSGHRRFDPSATLRRGSGQGSGQRFKRADFTHATYWKVRGKLNIPRERYIEYRELGTAGNGVYYGWAGWGPVDRAKALTYLLEQAMRRGLTDAIPRLQQSLRGLLPELKDQLAEWEYAEFEALAK